jgi:SAM-dependent MidA family methyltransferase
LSGPAVPTSAERRIRSRIAESGWITFHEFMEIALYHPGGGYYARDSATTGSQGDFSTSSDVSPLFGERLAVQAAEASRRAGGEGWQLVELGGGRGLLVADILTGLSRHEPKALDRLERIVLVEQSPALRRAQVERLTLEHPGVAVSAHASLAELADASVRGFVYANELLDALPVHLIERRSGVIGELYVAASGDGKLEFRHGPISERELEDLARRYGSCPHDGHRAELRPAIEPLLAELGRVVESGAVMFIDYGLEAAALADAGHRDGTLVAYRSHRVRLDVLENPGDQDLTAHVNWTQAEDAARAGGFDVAGRVRQDRMLLALGLLEDLRADTPDADFSADAVGRRLAAKRLIMPGAGGGERFEALILVRGIESDLLAVRPPASWRA